MMRTVGVALIGGSIALSPVSPVRAQGRHFTLSTGISLATGELETHMRKDPVNAGWLKQGGLLFDLPGTATARARVDLSYSRHSLRDGSGSFVLAGSTVNLVLGRMSGLYAFGGIGPYLIVGSRRVYVPAGCLFEYLFCTPGGSYDDSVFEMKPALNGGVGVRRGIGPVHAFLEARVLTIIGAATVVPVTLGIAVDLPGPR